jgi:hypothetical protein
MADSIITAALAAAASTAPSADDVPVPYDDDEEEEEEEDEDSGAFPSALVSYLQMEADLAEERAKRLRKKAADLIGRFGLTEDDLDNGNTGCDLAPLDEHGNPKYRGKKRGRKPKPRKRKVNPNREKRKHTGYTLFMQENHRIVKASSPNLQNKDVISFVAKQWKDLREDQKIEWKERAQTIIGSETGKRRVVGGSNKVTSRAAIGPQGPVDEMQEMVSNNDASNNYDDGGEGTESETGADDDDGYVEDNAINIVPPARKRTRSQRK